MGDLADIASGGTPLRSVNEYWGGEIAWYSSGELNSEYTSPPNDKITAAGLDGSNAKLFPKGSLLIGMYDTAAMKMSILDRDAAFNQAIAAMRLNSGLDLRFVRLALETIKPEILAQRRGTRQKNLSLQKIKDIQILLPPLEEQRRIVAILNEAFEGLSRARANAEANLLNAQELYGRCRDGLLACNPGWEELPLSELLKNITYGFTNPMPDADKGPFKVTAKNVTGGKIDYGNARRTTIEAYNDLLTDKSRPQIGDVLLTKDGTLGRTAVVDRDDICVNQSVAVLRANLRVVPDYLSELLACSRHQEAMIADAGGTTIKHLYITRVPKIIVELPKVDEQKKLLKRLAELKRQCTAVEQAASKSLQDLDDLRKSVLQKAFAGELTAREFA